MGGHLEKLPPGPLHCNLVMKFPFLSYSLKERGSPHSSRRPGISHGMGQSPQPRASALSLSFHSVPSGMWGPCEGAHGQPVPSSRQCSLAVKRGAMLGRAGCPHTLQGSPNTDTDSAPVTCEP